MISIEKKLDGWKNKLLDLGKRNLLMNYRDTKRSNLRIFKPTLFDLWESFVQDEKPLIFDYFDDDGNLIVDLSATTDTENEIYGFNSSEENDNDVQTDFQEKRSVVTNQNILNQQKTLRNLRNKAKVVMDNQGINALYLSFGFLKWKENSSSEQYYLAPIILVPVSLTIDSIMSPFVLSIREEEIVINPTLLHKMNNDFGITFPEFNEDSSPNEYFSSIRQLLKINHWEVVEDVGLSLLSYLRISMYTDLENHKEKVISHPVVKALAGIFLTPENGIGDLSEINLDKDIHPADVFQVVDADSSQQEAILFAKRGASFVLQGPPGTGKSQTITNIIAECLADGKKVLFVSEKMAALDVVQRRLSSAGLDPFCLVLHSYRANKKDVLNQLANVIELAENRADVSDEAFQKLDRLQSFKDTLNEYAEEIFTKIQPLNKTIYEVNGHIARLEPYPDISFSFDITNSLTAQQYNQIINTLHHYIGTIGLKCDDYKQNPWYLANIDYVSNELRHDITVKANKLIDDLETTQNLIGDIETRTNLKCLHSYGNLCETISILELSSGSPKIPYQWVVEEDLSLLLNDVEDIMGEIRDFYQNQRKISEQLYEIKEILGQTQHPIQFDGFRHLLDENEIRNLMAFNNQLVQSYHIFSVWRYNNIESIRQHYYYMRKLTIQYNQLRTILSQDFDAEIFTIDYRALLTKFRAEHSSPMKMLNRKYKEDKRYFRSIYHGVENTVNDGLIILALTKLKEMDQTISELRNHEPILRELFLGFYKGVRTDFASLEWFFILYQRLNENSMLLEHLLELSNNIANRDHINRQRYGLYYDGINTDWDIVIEALKFAQEFRNISSSLSDEFVKNVCSDDETINACKDLSIALKNLTEEMNPQLNWFVGLFEEHESLTHIDLPALSDRITACKSNLSQLEKWIDFKQAREDCIQLGLGNFLEKTEEEQVDSNLIIPIFEKRFYRLWLDAVLPQYPAVNGFRKATQEKIISDFSALDIAQFEIAKARIKKRLMDQLPEVDRFTTGIDELGILKRELNKQKRIKPIRKLFREIPHLLLTLKPCLMMSPLSVSLFLEADSYMFDTVIFDEASQVCTENAIGAIIRGKQVVIAGDSKQLPPTNFFIASTSNTDNYNDEEDDDDVEGYESILDEAYVLPEKTLRWHYRSRHEHLIAFSNAKIYNNRLITFPSNIDNSPDNGVEYFLVKDGIYDRGGRQGNVREAQRVAELVFDHIKHKASRSLGVIAFGETQQLAIETAVRYLRKSHSQYEWFFNEDKIEPFFIRNLETVQGDERDTIIFSIGYAKDNAGKMYMNFGPLSKTGGERRLNVAITRAKYNVKLVGSILPSDFNIEGIISEGPKLLRSYIDFAQNGISTLQSEIDESDEQSTESPFEDAVYNFLDRRGYKLSTQVGCSGYRIDMAVKHPTQNNKYAIGIECDGASYHSARTTRERDRLRQDVLEGMGWRIYRIWSTDWNKDPLTEGQRLINAIETAISEQDNNTETSITVTESNQTQEQDVFLEVTQKKTEECRLDNPYEFEEYEETDIFSVRRVPNSNEYLANVVFAIIQKEYPIHLELISKKVAYIFGNEHATVRVRTGVEQVIRRYLYDKVTKRNDFYFIKGYEKVVPRKPKSEDNIRSIEYIHRDEIIEAMKVIINSRIGISPEVLLSETTRVFGYNRAGNRIKSALGDAYKTLLESGKVQEEDGKISMNCV